MAEPPDLGERQDPVWGLTGHQTARVRTAPDELGRQVAHGGPQVADPLGPQVNGVLGDAKRPVPRDELGEERQEHRQGRGEHQEHPVWDEHREYGEPGRQQDTCDGEPQDGEHRVLRVRRRLEEGRPQTIGALDEPQGVDMHAQPVFQPSTSARTAESRTGLLCSWGSGMRSSRLRKWRQPNTTPHKAMVRCIALPSAISRSWMAC